MLAFSIDYYGIFFWATQFVELFCTYYLSAWYWRIKQKKGAKKAIVALARKLLVIIYTMLKQGTLFDESCFETRRKRCEQKQLSRYIRELEKHGYHVEVQS